MTHDGHKGKDGARVCAQAPLASPAPNARFHPIDWLHMRQIRRPVVAAPMTKLDDAIQMHLVARPLPLRVEVV